MLDIEGYDGLHADLNAMSKQSRWTELATLIPDELVAEVTVVGPRSQIPDQLAARVAGITDHVSPVNNRNPDHDLFADIVEDLRALSSRQLPIGQPGQ